MPTLEALKRSSKRALIIAAHPDDESLFMGGTIAEFKKWRWTILCITDCDERYNKKRRRELLRVCQIYNRNGTHVKPAMLGVVKKSSRFLKVEAVNKIRDFIDELGPFDIIFTHNKKGEYGHKTHILIHEAVKRLKLPNIYYFMKPTKEYLYPPLAAKQPKRIQIKLSPKSRRAKRQALNIYLRGSQKTNLSRLKRVVNRAINNKIEYIQYAN
jgi:hypothetical protein